MYPVSHSLYVHTTAFEKQLPAQLLAALLLNPDFSTTKFNLHCVFRRQLLKSSCRHSCWLSSSLILAAIFNPHCVFRQQLLKRSCRPSCWLPSSLILAAIINSYRTVYSGNSFWRAAAAPAVGCPPPLSLILIPPYLTRTVYLGNSFWRAAAAPAVGCTPARPTCRCQSLLACPATRVSQGN